jgi:hypothetical protein
VRVAEEHPQDARSVTNRAPRQPRAGTLDAVGAEDRRRELLDRLDPDASEIVLEALEVMAIAENGGRTKATLLDEIVEEARQDETNG